MLAKSANLAYMGKVTSDTSRLGQYIRRLREELGMSQEELGKAVGLTRGYISQIETGIQRDLNMTNYQAFSRALHVPIEDLFIAAGYLPERPETPEDRELQGWRVAGLTEEEIERTKQITDAIWREAQRQAAERRKREAEEEAKRKGRID